MVSMDKIPVGKIVLLVFYPPKYAAVNVLARTVANFDFTEGLLCKGFSELERRVTN